MIQVNTVTIFYFVFVLILMAMIIYYNVIAGLNYSKSLVVKVQEPLQCEYKNLPTLNDNNIDDNKYFITKDNICFSLSTKPVFYLNICNQLCGGGTNTTGQCNDNGNPGGYDNCVKTLKPSQGCKNSASPLASLNGVDYYAQSVSLNSPC